MEIVTSLSTNINGANGGTKKHIQEWSRLDKLTGMLEHARVEADHWASNTSNSRHHFGKVVDSRARNLADGSVQQKQQTKQLEVFQAHIPGGSVQVIRSHTSTTSSWHNSKVLQSQTSSWSSSPADNLLNRRIGDMEIEIDNLKFDHNPVNLDSQKSKANIARHLGNRRPPTRSKMSRINHEDTVFTHLPITYDFHEVKEENKDKMNNDISKSTDSMKISSFNLSVNTSTTESNREKLDKKKSISNENLSFTSHLDSETADEKESSYPWIRSSLARRSYQHPPTSRYKTNMEKSAEHVPGNKSELENVLGKVLRRRADFESWSKTPSSAELQKPTPLLCKKSFVTEATLQETKRKLRHLSSDRTPILRNSLEEIDDGVFIESKSNLGKENGRTISKDLDNMVIESTSPTCLDFRLINKSDDWFDRRKSYGFEPVSQPNTTSSLNSTPKTNSSTDSGICRSSELELASTSMIKKVTEAKDDCAIHSSNDEEIKPRSEFTIKNEVPKLLKQLEKFDKPKTSSGATIVKFTESQDVIKKGKVLEAIKNFEKNGISRKIPELTSLTKSGSYFLEDLNEKPSQHVIEPDILGKRHSIACDDTKYMASMLTIPEPLSPEKAPSPGKSTVVNVNNFESSNTSSPITDTDAKKPKKVEFSRTEVHFAATEPGKIRIVETNEKPPSTNLYRRKKRSVSVSPKSDLPQTTFGGFEKLTNPENPPDNKLNEDSTGFRSHFTSTVSDNGLAVTITSTKPTDYRRASWSLIENSNSSPVQLENKMGYSTKINFGGEGVIVVADAKSPLHEKTARKSHISATKATNKTKIPDTSQNSENIHERLIVSIGGSSNGNHTTGKYIQKPTFTNSFRNSIKSSKAAVGLEKLASKKNDGLKSTSLIISTIKQSVNKKPLEKSNNEIMEKKTKITNVKTERSKPTAEQPSTYITEMNKLQQKYRVKENQMTINRVIKKDATKNHFYNTIPAPKNGHVRTKLLTNDLPAVLSAFDNLCRTIDEVMEKKTTIKHQNKQDHLKIVENLSIPTESFHKKPSSQSRLHDNSNSISQDDGNISDDSLKADKEVQSYMSTAIMEEYENELCGSWSRKRYFKHIKPIKIVQQDEISEECHFKPLKNDEDEIRIIANMTDIKKPKIAPMATIKLKDNMLETKNSFTNSKKSTILLNKSPRIEAVFNDGSAKDKEDDKKKPCTPLRITNPNSSKMNDYVNVTDYREPKQGNHLTKASAEEISKSDSDPVKVMYHDIELAGKVPQNEKEKKPYLVRKDSDRESLKYRRKISSKDSSVHNDNIRRSMKSLNIKEKLPDSGRDSWLNLPKDCKVLSEKRPIENGKHKIYGKPHIDHVKKDRQTRSGINGCGDISSEEDLTKKSSKVYIPLNTIHEKSRIAKTPKFPVTKMASNSSTENQSSSFKFKNPILKTEERSQRRAARILQQTSSREMLMSSNIASSSDDITSENERHHLRTSKPRSIRKSKSTPKTTKSVSTTSNLPPKKTVTSSAKMQINIFNIKDRMNHETRSTRAHNTSSKSSNCIDNVKSSRCRPQTSQQKTYANVPEKSRTKPVSCSNRDTKNLSTLAVKSTRPIH
ncbi:uncharacterized protein LOC135831880 isoform X1 [Planococcus citri]|uniref:uncharacterized protein LOC135831880 isoform X1 n=1 Tax=Planococcus citri TaxID=170843 RepID=UPI0031F8DB27